MGPWITNAELKTALADALNKADSTTLAVSDAQLEKANRWAAGAIHDVLVGRGFGDYLDTWDRREEFNESLGLFWLFTLGGVPYASSDLFVNKLDRRKELETARVFVNGVMVRPTQDYDESPAGSVGGGVMGSGFEPLSW